MLVQFFFLIEITSTLTLTFFYVFIYISAFATILEHTWSVNESRNPIDEIYGLDHNYLMSTVFIQKWSHKTILVIPPSVICAPAPVHFLAFMGFKSSVSLIQSAMISANSLVRTNTMPLMSLSSRYVSNSICFSFSNRGFSSLLCLSAAEFSKLAFASANGNNFYLFTYNRHNLTIIRLDALSNV